MILRFSLRGLSLNKDTIPSEIAGKPAVYLEPLQNINQQNIIMEKKVFYSQMTRLHQNNNLNYSRLLWLVAHCRERNRNKGNITLKRTLSKHKEINYRTTHFPSWFQRILFFFSYKKLMK